MGVRRSSILPGKYSSSPGTKAIGFATLSEGTENRLRAAFPKPQIVRSRAGDKAADIGTTVAEVDVFKSTTRGRLTIERGEKS